MIVLKRALVSLFVMIVTFIGVFLAIFVLFVLYDLRSGPHDAQGGLAGVIFGPPVAFVAALIMGPLSFAWITKRRWFEELI
jgi:Na+-driven multidrug efflux pump